MRNSFQSMYELFANSSKRQLEQQLAWYKRENKILRNKLPKRITITRQERQLLLKFGKPLGKDIRQLITIVHPNTFLRWVREESKNNTEPVARGRRRTALAIRRLICKLARENDWGYGRIVGELKKLGIHSVSASTVRNVLRNRGLEPSPERRGSTWNEFVKRHASTLWQCDFFSQKTITFKGVRRLYVLVFLHVQTRRVYLSPATFYPNEEWVRKQSADFVRQARSDGFKIKQVIHDRDTKFAKSFRKLLRSKRIKPIRIAYRAPNMNAFVERFIWSVRYECLYHFVVLGQRHLDYLLSEYRAYYHRLRPHQGRDNIPLDSTPQQRRKKRPPDEPDPKLGEIRCQKKLGGLIKHYYREAA